MSRLALALTLLLPLSAASALPPVPPRTPAPAPAPLPDVVLPDVQPPPPPVPVPAGRVKLGGDVFSVAYSDADFVVLASPEGLVKVTREAGPLRVRGRFVEAPGVVQTKTFPGKFVVSVEAVASGKCDLLVGADLARLKRVCLDVAVGPAPPPDPPAPPGPGPDPKPDPKPPAPTPIPGEGFHALIVYDEATLTAMPKEQQSILFAAEPRAYLTAKAATVGGKADWAIWDKNADATKYPSPPLRAMFARPRAAVPWVVLSNTNPPGFYEGALPANVVDAMALFRRYAEGTKR